jgi:hypothetical protein
MVSAADQAGRPVATCAQYGACGVFGDSGVGSASIELTVDNVDPTLSLDLSVAVDVNGTPTLIALTR